MHKIDINPNTYLKRVIKIYSITEGIRFCASFFLAIEIFRRLDIADYAIYAIVQSLSALTALFFTLNIDSSMQKVYSKRYITPYANLEYSCLLLLFIIIGSITVFSISVIVPEDFIALFGGAILPIPLLLGYTLSLTVNGYLQSYFNASGRTNLYSVTVFLQPLILLCFITLVDIDILEEIILYSAISYLLPTLTLLYSINKIERCEFKSSRLIFLLKYIISYSLPSFPALSSKLFLEYLARIGVLAASGEIGVAALVLVNTIFSIFRSIEKAFYRAVAPFIISPLRTLDQVHIMTKMVSIQSIFVVSLFSLSSYWTPLLIILFPEKPSEVFSPVLMWLMGIVYVLSLWKNYYMTFCKSSIKKIKKFFYVATIHNIIAIIVLSFFNLTADQYLSLLIFVNIMNVSFLKRQSYIS
jgi:O-antigen/teichoic acid export membrane protein